nr:CoA transferase [Nocardioides humi]
MGRDAEIIEHPALQARQRVFTVKHPLNGDVRFIGWPMRFSAAPASAMPGPAPMLGQHNDEILADLGFDEDERAVLRRDGVIGDEFAPQAR